MKRIDQTTVVLAAALALLGGVFGSLNARAQEGGYKATIRIDVQAEKAPVPAELYGIFMEEINHAFDGGLYAELIRNRAFEEGIVPPGMKLVENDDGSLRMELESLPPGVPEDQWPMPWPWNMNCRWDPGRALIGWSLETEGGAEGHMELTEEHRLNPARERSLRLVLSPPETGAGRVRLVNSGYWGINVQEGTPYELKFHLRPESYRGTVAATLETQDGRILARHDFGAVEPGDAWRAFTATLRAEGTDSGARFVLSFRGQGTTQVDWVSLFPPTFKDRPHGLRRDLAQYLADLKPAFVRYPGGCYAQGLSWESAPDWRRMVVPHEERPGMWGYWQYRSTDGFGYHEFLQFCDDIGADALYVAFAGMTVHPHNNLPLDELEPVIQQTLDAIEYAIGPVDSKWGAKRAAMGRIEPFPLKYVQIGNEHPPAVYGEYYKRFRDAIKAKYPDMTVIMSMYWSGLNWPAIERAGHENIDMVDEHAYRPLNWIRTHFDYFDKYKRTPWKVYVGEYAAHHAHGDWGCAMDDSVFLMMMERNGDLVKMASYAPLLCNVNARNWGVNLIDFDASRSFAHASYYVQKLFNETRPDVNLATSTAVEPKPDPAEPLLAGRIGLGAWHTLTEYKELRLHDEDGNLVYRDDFANLDAWETPGTGTWEVADGILRQTDEGTAPAVLLLKDKKLEVGKMTVKARRAGGREGFLLMFNAGRPDQYLFGNYGAAGNAFHAIQQRGAADGYSFRGGRTTQGAIEEDRWYELSIVVGRDRAEMLLDGKVVADAGRERLPVFFATAGYDRADEMVVLRATNYHGEAVPVRVQLDGAEWVGATGQHYVIEADCPRDENTLDEPRRIVPEERSLPDCGRRMSVTLPPYSVNVLRIPAR